MVLAVNQFVVLANRILPTCAIFIWQSAFCRKHHTASLITHTCRSCLELHILLSLPIGSSACQIRHLLGFVILLALHIACLTQPFFFVFGKIVEIMMRGGFCALVVLFFAIYAVHGKVLRNAIQMMQSRSGLLLLEFAARLRRAYHKAVDKAFQNGRIDDKVARTPPNGVVILLLHLLQTGRVLR